MYDALALGSLAVVIVVVVFGRIVMVVGYDVVIVVGNDVVMISSCAFTLVIAVLL